MGERLTIAAQAAERMTTSIPVHRSAVLQSTSKVLRTTIFRLRHGHPLFLLHKHDEHSDLLLFTKISDNISPPSTANHDRAQRQATCDAPYSCWPASITRGPIQQVLSPCIDRLILK